MSKDLEPSPFSSTPWLRQMSKYIASGQKARALQVLEKVIEYDMPLFKDDPGVLQDRRFAWLCKNNGDDHAFIPF